MPGPHLTLGTACALLLLAGGAAAAPPDPVFPGATWSERAPYELGLDGRRLDEVAELIGGHGVIVHRGEIVKSWGDPTLRAEWASAAKPVVSTMLLFAIHEGLIDSADVRLADLGIALQPHDQEMTFRHLANMTGGYIRDESPGSAWAYNDYGIRLYVEALFDTVFGESANGSALDPTRLGRLGLEDGSLFSSRDGYGVRTSARDFARIGWWWLNRGLWDDEQVLPSALFTEHLRPAVATTLPRTMALHPAGDYLDIGSYGGGSDQTPHGPGIYGFNWWFNAEGVTSPDARFWPDAPRDTFQANGHFGREVLTVIPSLRMVLAYHGGQTLGFDPGNPDDTTNVVLGALAASLGPPVDLRLGKDGAGALRATWSPDCDATWTGYGLYEGTLGDWTSHNPVTCSDDGGDLEETFTPAGGDRYYLVVPNRPDREGSYGTLTGGQQRAVGAASCRSKQVVLGCS